MELAGAITRDLEFPDGLITVVRVKCSSDLKHATASISVLPEGVSGSALRVLRRANKIFNEAMSRHMKLRVLPRIHWVVDNQERYSVQMEKAIREAKKYE
jgi:ribosome-binding factor A